ncbi:MAG: YeeE/YedE family protein [Bacteroidales bacterium]|nr:YeeE/YedE family protein [Bacteroidales bacterium]
MKSLKHRHTDPDKYMNPYVAGVLLGFVIIAAFFFSGEGVGGSGAFKDIVKTTVVKVAPEYAANTHYFKSATELDHSPMKTWLIFEVLGILLGGIVSGAFAGRLKLKIEHSPNITSKKRIVYAVIGGALFGIGSQLGRGCTSGAGLSGMAVMSVSGFIAAMAIFGSGYLFAWFFRKLWI